MKTLILLSILTLLGCSSPHHKEPTQTVIDEYHTIKNFYVEPTTPLHPEVLVSGCNSPYTITPADINTVIVNAGLACNGKNFSFKFDSVWGDARNYYIVFECAKDD